MLSLLNPALGFLGLKQDTAPTGFFLVKPEASKILCQEHQKGRREARRRSGESSLPGWGQGPGFC